MANILTAGNSSNGGTAISTDTSGTLNIVTGSGSGATAVTVDGSQNVTIAGTNLIMPTANSGIEIGSNAVNTPYIDFHSSANSVDLDSRIIASGGTSTAGNGTLSIISSLFQFNSGYGSSATAYGCRAWVNFNGTGTVAIRASGNVTSITDNGTGDYTVNLTNSMPDINYAVTGTASRGHLVTNNPGGFGLRTQPTNSAIRVCTSNGSGTIEDSIQVDISIFR
jgi:hypothetical protein